jgi:hypothetical protein
MSQFNNERKPLVSALLAAIVEEFSGQAVSFREK